MYKTNGGLDILKARFHTLGSIYGTLMKPTRTLFQLPNFVFVLRNFRLEFLVHGSDFLGLHVLEKNGFLLMVFLLMAQLFLKLLKNKINFLSVYKPTCEALGQ